MAPLGDLDLCLVVCFGAGVPRKDVVEEVSLELQRRGMEAHGVFENSQCKCLCCFWVRGAVLYTTGGGWSEMRDSKGLGPSFSGVLLARVRIRKHPNHGKTVQCHRPLDDLRLMCVSRRLPAMAVIANE